MRAASSDMVEFRVKAQRRLTTKPVIPATAFVAEGVHLMGHVVLGEYASVWYQTVLRGDIEPIIVGEKTNIQDAAILHTADDLPCRIGDRCTVGHSAIVHACTVGDECLVGMGAILLDGCKIGSQSIIGAATLVTQNMKIPEGSLVLGSPGKVVRSLSRKERHAIRRWADRYVILAKEHRKQT